MNKLPIGKLFMATVDGVDATVLVSLETELKGDNRQSCFRYGPPSNHIIPRASKIVILHEIQTINTDRAKSLRKTNG